MSKHVKNYAEFVNEQKALLEYDRSSFRHAYIVHYHMIG